MLKMKSTTKQFSSRVEKLEDVSLENVSGGVKPSDVLFDYGFVAIQVGAIGTLGCSIAGFDCQGKATKYMQQGDKTKSEKYSKAAKGLGIATMTCAGLATSGVAAGFIGCGLYKHGH